MDTFLNYLHMVRMTWHGKMRCFPNIISSREDQFVKMDTMKNRVEDKDEKICDVLFG